MLIFIAMCFLTVTYYFEIGFDTTDLLPIRGPISSASHSHKHSICGGTLAGTNATRHSLRPLNLRGSDIELFCKVHTASL